MLLLKVKVQNNIVDAFKDVLRAGVRPSNIQIDFSKVQEVRELLPDTLVYLNEVTIFEIGILNSIRDSLYETEKEKAQMEAFFEGIVVGLTARKFNEPEDDNEGRFSRIAVA